MFSVTHWILPPHTAKTDALFITYLVGKALKRTAFRLVWLHSFCPGNSINVHLCYTCQLSVELLASSAKNLQILIHQNVPCLPSVPASYKLNVFRYCILTPESRMGLKTEKMQVKCTVKTRILNSHFVMYLPSVMLQFSFHLQMRKWK